MNYSVLMSVYYKEKPDNLRESMLSIWNQTVQTNDFVLLCDGPLTKELDDIIDEMKTKYPNTLNVIRMKENRGLGAALNFALPLCKNEWVGRMDSDDISLPDRFEKQIKMIQEDPELDILGGGLEEFGILNKHRKRIPPSYYEDIIEFSKKRCPFNHPTIIYRKAEVQAVGGYEEQIRCFEDYPLWIKMLKNGAKAVNSQDILLKMRVSAESYGRRGGFKYAKSMIKFRYWMYKIGWIGFWKFLSIGSLHFLVCILPSKVRKWFYLSLLSN